MGLTHLFGEFCCVVMKNANMKSMAMKMKKEVRTPRLGQHFLTRPEIARKMAEGLDFSNTPVVLEIGPGHGILTRELLKVAKCVVAVEKDKNLVKELEETFAKEILEKHLILIEEDVRDFDPNVSKHLTNRYALVANIPYYITGHIVRQFLTSEKQPSSITILIQKEVAERIVAKNGKHSLLSLSVWVYGTPKIEKVVKAGAFSPPPKVDSAILSIRNISRNFFKNEKQEKHFFLIIKKAFAQKRKTIGATLKNVVKNNDFAKYGVDTKTRPEDVSLEIWVHLSLLH